MKTLVIGGTGMLAGATRALLAAGDEVYSLSRHAPEFTHERLRVLLLDYHDSGALHAALQPHAPFDRALVWVHSSAPEAPFIAAGFVRGPFVQVLGSHPPNAEERRVRFTALGTDHREAQLGGRFTPHGFRWLTHEEISAGALRAVQGGAKYTLVGRLQKEGRL